LIQRVNRLPIQLPEIEYGDKNAAVALQEVLGGKVGIMTSLNSYMYQSFNFRKKVKLKPFYDLVATISTEKFGHVELVATAINLLYKDEPLDEIPERSTQLHGRNMMNTIKYVNSAYTATPYDSNGLPWTGEAVSISGNLGLDLINNFHMECSTLIKLLRVTELTDHPVAKEVLGYLLVRGRAHIVAFAKALEMATGVDYSKIVPIPKIDHCVMNEMIKYEELGYGHILYTWNDIGDYTDIIKIWKGHHPITGQKLIIKEGVPEDGSLVPTFDDLSDNYAPGIGLEDFHAIAKRLLAKM